MKILLVFRDIQTPSDISDRNTSVRDLSEIPFCSGRHRFQ